MNLDDFLNRTKERIPSARELIALCDALNIRFRWNADGKPCLTVNESNRAEGEMLAKLIRREPFRTAVIESRLNKVNEGPVQTTMPEPPAPSAGICYVCKGPSGAPDWDICDDCHVIQQWERGKIG